MIVIPRDQVPERRLPGRSLQDVVGKHAFTPSSKMTMGFARYSPDSGPMEPHRHAEEIVYILDAKDGWVRYGSAKEQLGERLPLAAGMTLHVPELEWHVFGYDGDGFIDAIVFYGQVDNIRPEDILRGTSEQ